MRLSELEPMWLRYLKVSDTVFHVKVSGIEHAQGIRFLCPKCYAANNGPIGTHSVVCWSSSRGVPDDALPGPGRWALRGTSFNDLTLDCEPGKSRSVALLGGCAWHGYVTAGEAA